MHGVTKPNVSILLHVYGREAKTVPMSIQLPYVYASCAKMPHTGLTSCTRKLRSVCTERNLKKSLSFGRLQEKCSHEEEIDTINVDSQIKIFIAKT